MFARCNYMGINDAQVARFQGILKRHFVLMSRTVNILLNTHFVGIFHVENVRGENESGGERKIRKVFIIMQRQFGRNLNRIFLMNKRLERTTFFEKYTSRIKLAEFLIL